MGHFRIHAGYSKTVERRDARAANAVLTVGKPAKVNFGGERRYDCAQYQECLCYAIAKQWDSFECGACNDFTPSTELTEAAAGIKSSLAMARREGC